MPKFYTVATNNPFAALDEQEDGEELILNQSPEKLNQMAAEKEMAAAAAVAHPNAAKGGDQKKPRGPRKNEQGGALTQQRGGAPRRNPSPDAEDPVDEKVAHRPAYPRKPRPEGRLDRQSGTGHGREMKKHGAGNFNWGQPGDELNPVETTEAAGEPIDKEATEQKPENSVQTYADYKAEQEKTRGEGLEGKRPTKSDTTGVQGRVYTKVQNEESHVKSAAAPAATHIGTSSPIVSLRYNNPRPPREDRRQDRPERSDSKKSDRGSKNGSDLKLDDNKAFPTLAH